MSTSLKIIQGIIDENLIDAKMATQAYLNEILSEALKDRYEEVAPTVIGEKYDGKKKKGKKHSCANHVEHAEWGEGTCISESHANPDENGFVSWYDVEFEHGVEKRVPTEDLDILGEAMHEHAENPEDLDTIEEGKGKDKDGDGDGDFADIMMTRMMKSGMSKEEAMKKTRKHNNKGKKD
jgi:hypothetical protein